MFKDYLLDDNKWKEFLDYKMNKEYVNKREKDSLFAFISNGEYKDICREIVNGEYAFSVPKKHVISKNFNNKKRVIYTFELNEMVVLKYISYLFYDYDHLFCPNLYSFRKSIGVKKAIESIKNIKNINHMYGYKVDISNYFNDINVDILLSKLKNDIEVDLYDFISRIITNKKVLFNGSIIEEEKGIMAGSPISAFLANYYIKEIDNYFWQKPVVYFRYADDILLFCNTKEEIINYAEELRNFVFSYRLKINREKENYFEPQECFEFLGFSFCHNTIDISQNSLKKIKARIKRSARGIRRWMLKKGANSAVSLKAMIRKFNRKFYGNENSELSWRYWFFPQINTVQSLKEIDLYLQQELRYLVTGKHNKRNYELVPYEMLKKCNYRPLVSEYYKLLFDMKDKV